MSKWFKFAELAKLFVPLVVSSINPKLAPLGQTIADGISEAETIPGASNAEKLAHVQSLAHKTAVGLNQTGKTNIDLNTLDSAVDGVVTTGIKVVKLVHPPVAPSVTPVT